MKRCEHTRGKKANLLAIFPPHLLTSNIEEKLDMVLERL